METSKKTDIKLLMHYLILTFSVILFFALFTAIKIIQREISGENNGFWPRTIGGSMIFFYILFSIFHGAWSQIKTGKFWLPFVIFSAVSYFMILIAITLYESSWLIPTKSYFNVEKVFGAEFYGDARWMVLFFGMTYQAAASVFARERRLNATPDKAKPYDRYVPIMSLCAVFFMTTVLAMMYYNATNSYENSYGALGLGLGILFYFLPIHLFIFGILSYRWLRKIIVPNLLHGAFLIFWYVTFVSASNNEGILDVLKDILQGLWNLITDIDNWNIYVIALGISTLTAGLSLLAKMIMKSHNKEWIESQLAEKEQQNECI